MVLLAHFGGQWGAIPPKLQDREWLRGLIVWAGLGELQVEPSSLVGNNGVSGGAVHSDDETPHRAYKGRQHECDLSSHGVLRQEVGRQGLCPSGWFNVSQGARNHRIGWIDEHRYAGRCGHHFESFCCQLSRKKLTLRRLGSNLPLRALPSSSISPAAWVCGCA
jgi:hypothetical protein